MVPPPFLGCLRLSCASFLPLPRGTGASAAGLAPVGRKVVGTMIPEDIQKLLEGNHTFPLASPSAQWGKCAVVAGEEAEKLFVPHC